MLNYSDTNIKTEVMDGRDLNRNNSGLCITNIQSF